MKRILSAAMTVAVGTCVTTASARAAITVHNVTDTRVTFQIRCPDGETHVWRLAPRQTGRPECPHAREVDVRVLTEKPSGNIVASGMVKDGGSYVLQRDRDGDVVLVTVWEI